MRLRALLELLEDPKMNQQVMCVRTDFALKAGGFGRLGCAFSVVIVSRRPNG